MADLMFSLFLFLGCERDAAKAKLYALSLVPKFLSLVKYQASMIYVADDILIGVCFGQQNVHGNIQYLYFDHPTLHKIVVYLPGLYEDRAKLILFFLTKVANARY
jgi:hypothetical protein